MTKPVKYKGPQVVDDEVFAEIEGVLDLVLPEKLRDRISSGVLYYLWSRQHPRPSEAAVSDQLKAVKEAALELRKTLTEDPIEAAARAAKKAAMDELFKKYHGKTIPGDALRATMRALHDKLPDSAIKDLVGEGLKNLSDGDDKAPHRTQGKRIIDERAVYDWVKWQILHRAGINVDDIVEQLDQLCAVIDAREKSKGGRPGNKEWDDLMLNLADIYAEATGKQATVTENEHRAEAAERYSGAFVRVATVVDRATAESVGIEPRLNGALGPALRRLTKPRGKPGRSKTI
jgi:hypothetical protein